MSQKTILLTVDALRNDFFSSEHFPNCWPIFSEQFSIFENAYSNGTATPIAFPSLIAGETATGQGNISNDSVTLAELHSGLSIARPNNPHLSADRGYSQGFDQIGEEASLDPLSKIKSLAGRSELLSSIYNRTQNALNQSNKECPYNRAEAVSAAIAEDLESDPEFLWAHFMDPHTPHTPGTLPSNDLLNNREYYQDLSDRFHDCNVTDSEIEELEKLYAKHVRYLDRHLQDTLEVLMSKEWWDDALVIFVADHGEAFGEQGQLVHPWDEDPIEVTTHVPLAVKFPYSEPQTKLHHVVQHLDIYTEIASHTDKSVRTRGKKLLDDSERLVISKSNYSIRVRSETGSLVVRRDESKKVEGELTSEMKEIANSEKFPKIPLLNGDTLGVSDSDDVAERLEALGYK